jgi:acetoin utilization deacetylase AcuC-like enzyme
MRAFYHPEQALHDPRQFMRYGRLTSPKDLPERTERLIGALNANSISLERPSVDGRQAALSVHSEGYIRFLESVWDEWVRLPDHGPEVWPNTFPYWSGRPEDSVRPPCPAEGLVGRIGWYLGDLSVPMGPDTWLSTLRSCETAAAAADALLVGGNHVYALCRPSGHHARADRASGFCYINNAAVTAERLRSRYGKVAILDVDAHHGDGTQQIFYKRDDVLTISIHADPSNYYPFFTGYADETGHGFGAGFNLNLPLAQGSGSEAMKAAIDRATERIGAFGAEVLVLALGFDAHRLDPIGVLTLEAEDFGGIGRQIGALHLPTVVVQEGGYAIEVIGDCLSAFLEGLNSHSPGRSLVNTDGW